ncbi:MAG: hypothetical protein ACJAYS_001068 [Lentimonas sp.]|jgi:hypothetical protein
MNAEEQKSGDLSISDRKAVLLLNNDSLLPDPEREIEGIDLSKLNDYEFDAIADRILGYSDLSQIESARKNQMPESSLLDGANWNKPTSPDGYSSSYRPIKAILKASGMKDGDTFVDIGSSYGRVGCTVGVNFPNSRFLGFEIVKERVIEAQRVAEFLQLHNVNYFDTDVSADDFTIPKADWFFLYNPLNKEALAQILKKIHHSKENREARLIAKYTGDLDKYAKSPYLEFISKIGKQGNFDACWFYRFKHEQ